MTADQGLVVDLDAIGFPVGAVARSYEVPVVVDFHAGGCGPCQTLGPLLEEVVGEWQGAVALVRVDVDANPELARDYGVRGVPTVVALAEGEEVGRFTGSLALPQLRTFVAQLLTGGTAR